MKNNRFFCVLLAMVIFLGAFAVPAIASDSQTKPARYPDEGAFYGYGDDGIAELQYNARYLFEQRYFPGTIFQYEKETIDYIKTGNVTKMKQNILGMWELGAADVIINDLELSGGTRPETMDEIWALVDERRPEFGLGNEHVIDVTLEKIDADTDALIIELLDTEWTVISTYLAIAYNQTVGLKCFTLERSINPMGDDALYMFCFVEADSRGSYHLIDNDKQAFITAIQSVMSGAVEPATSQSKPN